MADNEVLEQNGADAATDAREQEQKKLTLDKIMREYDEKKAAAEKQKEEHSESFEAFCREQENVSVGDISGITDDSDDYDDSDMKIASCDVPFEDEDNEPTVEVEAPDADTQERDDKLDIMNAISRHYRDSREQTPADKKTEPKPEKTPEAKTECADGKCDLACPEGEVCVIEDGVKRCKPIDNETLKKAFGDGEDELFGGYSKKKKKKNRDLSIDEQADDESETETETEEKTEKFSRYDENGEKIERDSKFFSPVYEFTKGCAPETIFSKLRVKLLSSCFAMVAVFLLLIASFYTEIAPSIGLPHASVFEPGKTGAIFMLFDLQLLFFAVILKLNSVVRGAVGLFTKHKTSESVAFVSVVAALIHTVTLVVAAPYSKDLVPVCSVACLSVLLLAISDFLKAKTEFISFRVVGSEADKYAFKDISSSDESTPDEIVKYVPEGSNVLDIRKVSFVEDFFKRNTKEAPADKHVGKIILVAVIASLAVSAVYCGINGVPVYKALCAFASVLLTTVQSCMLLGTSLAESTFSQEAARKKCAFIGHEVTEDFENVSVVSFKDTEVFPPKDVKLINFRNLGPASHDWYLIIMERITKLIGGPMSEIFARAMSNIDIDHTDDKVVDIAPDGVWVKLDGENYYLGTASYMTANNFEIYTNSDVIDLDGCDVKPNTTLFLADSSYVVMTFSLKYELNRGFESVLRKLYTQNICARIKTLDPCINNDFISAELRRPERLFSVVKGEQPDEVVKREESISTSLVSTGEGGLINSFLLIRKLKKLLNINGKLKVCAVVLAFLIASLALLLGGAVLPPAVILLIQLFFVVPVYLASKFAAK